MVIMELYALYDEEVDDQKCEKESWYAHRQNGKCFEVLYKPVRDSK